MTTPQNNNSGMTLPELSVSDLSGALKSTLEDAFGRVRVRGELSKVAFPASGHMYSALKDENAVIDAVCWRSQLARLKIRPEEGMDVICTGRITTYPARSSYQLVIEDIELAGIGALLKMVEERRIRLMTEGLFDESRKKQLPPAPRVIGIITSPTGAVIQDILHRLTDRFPIRVILWPVTVQGTTAADDVANALVGFSELQENATIPRPDLLIVARGGGSIEDLMPFNEEVVVRAAASCTIPIISAVGHETDTTLLDYVADLRAPTPTAAAEMAVPVRTDLMTRLSEIDQRLFKAGIRQLREEKTKLIALNTQLGEPTRFLEFPIQKLDHTSTNLDRVIQNYLALIHATLSKTTARLTDPARFVEGQCRILTLHHAALIRASNRLLDRPKDHLAHIGRILETVSFHHVLARGYAVVRNNAGHIITCGATLDKDTSVDILFSDQTTRSALIKK